MRKILLTLCVCFGLSAFGGERYLGVIVTGAGLTKSNSTTASTFTVPIRSKLSVQCDVDSFVVISISSTAPTMPGQGVKILADQLFQTSTTNDGTAYVWIYSVGASNCKVFERRGDE